MISLEAKAGMFFKTIFPVKYAEGYLHIHILQIICSFVVIITTQHGLNYNRIYHSCYKSDLRLIKTDTKNMI